MSEHFDVEAMEGFHPEIGILLTALVDSTREWREQLGNPGLVPLQWQPVPHSHSIGCLILHMIDCESYWFENVIGGHERDKAESELWLSDQVQQYDGKWPQAPAHGIEWYFAEQDRVRVRAMKSLKGRDPVTVYQRNGYTCTLRWIVSHVLQHDSYTGGQAVLMHELFQRTRQQAHANSN